MSKSKKVSKNWDSPKGIPDGPGFVIPEDHRYDDRRVSKIDVDKSKAVQQFNDSVTTSTTTTTPTSTPTPTRWTISSGPSSTTARLSAAPTRKG